LPLPPFFSEARTLTGAEIAHRRQMLGHLQGSRAHARGAIDPPPHVRS
jgi:hypothetical protein